jgi:hypothetical protein
MRNPFINIDTNDGPLSLSIHFGGLVPDWNLVLVCWEHETVGRRVDDQLVAVWAHSLLGATVTASVAAATAATSATTPTFTAAAPAASTAVSFGHSR